MIRRLRVKFICINMAIVTVMMLAILGMLLHFTRNDLEQQSIRVMQSVMEDRAYPSRPGEFPRQAQLPYFYVSVNTLGELSASFGGYYDLTNTEAIQEIITLALNSDDQTGILKDYSLRFQKRTTPFGQTIVFVDMSSELATMPGDRCILQLRGLPPFYSKKYDLKQHPNYKYTAEADKVKNAFDLNSLVTRRMDKLNPNETYTVYKVDVPDEAITGEDEDILNYDDLDDPDTFV